jgi:replicative DNA helicase
MTPTLVELSPQALRVLLAAAFFDEGFFRKFWPLLTPDFWGDRYYNAIAVFVDEFHKKYQRQPAFETMVDFFASDPDLSEEERGVYGAVFDDLLSSPMEDLPFYVDHLRTFIRRNAFTNALQDAEKALEGNRFEAIVSGVTAANLVAVERDFGTVNFFRPESVETRTDRRLDTTSVHIRRVACWIGTLDNYIRSGLPPGTLSVFVGATGVGKSMALVHCARMAVLQNFKVIYVSLELEASAVSDRFDSAFSGVPFDRLTDMAGDVRKRMQDSFSRYGDALRIIEYPETSLTPDSLNGLIEVLRRDSGFAPDVVVVDYADLMKPSQTYKDRRFELSSIYTMLHRIAKAQKVVLITATQARRDAIGKRIVGLADISEDISKAWIADHIFGICQTLEEAQQNRARLFVAKNRSGKPFQEISFDQDYSTCIFAKPGRGAARTVPASEHLKKTTTLDEEIERIVTEPEDET